MGDITLLLLLFAAFSVAWIEFLPKRFDAVPKLAVAVIIIGAGIHWLPNWYGWVVILLGLVDLVWTYHAFARDSQWPGPIIVLTRAARVTLAVIRGCGRFVIDLFARRKRSAAQKEKILLSKDERAARILNWSSGLAVIRGCGRFVIDLFARRKRSAAQKEKIPLSKDERAARIRKWSSGLALIIVSPVAAMPAILIFALVLVGLDIVTNDAPGFDEGLAGFIKDWLGWSFVTLGVVLDVISKRFLLALPALIVAGSVGATFVLKSGSYWRRFGLAALAIGTLYPVTFLGAWAFGWFDEPFFN